ncbi:MAG TPA: hypothetical protein PKI19_04815 [Elusimicrobiales bacterium]|nr:hypothetical protein [Elusimicrobiales bacterium]
MMPRFALPPRLRPALPVLLAAVVSLLALNKVKGIQFGAECLQSGSFLLTGIYSRSIAGSMPLYGTLGSLWSNLGWRPELFFIAGYFGTYLLVFSAGALLRGYWAGVFSLLAAYLFESLGGFNYNMEQSFYAFLLMLVLALTLLYRREKSVKSALPAGLAAGFSMLVRPSLFLFPPVFVLCGWFCEGGRPRKFLLRSLVFLAASYCLLLPWGAVRYPISGKFSVFDERRAAPAIIAAARFSVFTMEGDYRRVAGIGEEDSPARFFLREVSKKPLLFALTVLRRLWQIFLFDPLLFGLLLAALAAGRDRERRFNFVLPVYFILIHSALAVEKRYLYPLVYLIPPLLAGSFPPWRAGGGEERCAAAEKTARALFWACCGLVLAIEGLVLAYPARSARNALDYKDFSRALRRWPGDAMVQKMGCDKLLKAGDHPGFYRCLDGYAKKFDDKLLGYFLLARASRAPAGLALPADLEMRCLMIRMLRELELGDQAAAKVSFAGAFALYEQYHNMLTKVVYAPDREVLRFMRQNSSAFWDEFVYEYLALWPPEGMAKILAGMKKQFPLTPRYRLLDYAFGKKLVPVEMAGCRFRESFFSSLVRDILRSCPGRPERLSAKAGAGRPLARAYLRNLSAPDAGGPGAMPGQCASEEELFHLLLLRGAAPSARAQGQAHFMGRLYKRPVYYALSALLSPPRGASAAPEAALDALESGLRAEPPEIYVVPAAAGKSKKLSDAAVVKMRAGDPEGAEELLLEAVDRDPGNVEALMNLCAARVSMNKKELALEACRGAAAAVYSDPEKDSADLGMLAAEASAESYALLDALGRGPEAEAALRLAVDRAPAAWPGLARAKSLLKARAGKNAPRAPKDKAP